VKKILYLTLFSLFFSISNLNAAQHEEKKAAEEPKTTHEYDQALYKLLTSSSPNAIHYLRELIKLHVNKIDWNAELEAGAPMEQYLAEEYPGEEEYQGEGENEGEANPEGEYPGEAEDQGQEITLEEFGQFPVNEEVQSQAGSEAGSESSEYPGEMGSFPEIEAEQFPAILEYFTPTPLEIALPKQLLELLTNPFVKNKINLSNLTIAQSRYMIHKIADQISTLVNTPVELLPADLSEDDLIPARDSLFYLLLRGIQFLQPGETAEKFLQHVPEALKVYKTWQQLKQRQEEKQAGEQKPEKKEELEH
jgi:hypothetical protein